MLATESIIIVSMVYIGILFAVAYYGDKRADAGRSIINNPYVYALSLAVYCTAWTFYGSVGRAVNSGPAFLSIYIGPTLMMTLGWGVLRKIMRISRELRITSIADFIASRYGKSMLLGGLVAVIAVLGIVPYISLQLKAISTSFQILSGQSAENAAQGVRRMPFFQDNAFYVAFLLAAFAVLFGTRKPDATERHEGLVAAIALESIIKLIAFLAVGVFTTFYLFDGFGNLFQATASRPEIKTLLTFFSNESNACIDWSVHVFLSMLAIILLPRQFQMAVIENVDEGHLKKAIWLFPLYMLAINVFVLPVALAGMHQFTGQPMDADTFVLNLPLVHQQKALTLLVFIGGMSAATGMVIVETIALSTMISNNLVMPLLLNLPQLKLADRDNLGTWLVAIRHGAIVLVILLGYIYYHLTAEFYPLVSIGLVSFAAVAQFAPALLGGIFWKGGTSKGALWSMVVGFVVWGYTLVLPSLAAAGIFSQTFIQDGPWGVGWLKPFSLFGLQQFDHISHAVFWSLLLNSLTYVAISLFSTPTALEHSQATLFVDVFRFGRKGEASPVWRGTALIPDLTVLLERFLGKLRAQEALGQYARIHNIDWRHSMDADPGFVTHVEKLLAGAIGKASARLMLASVVKEEPLGVQEVMNILDETRQAISYSHELENVTTDLKAANERLKELDRLKDEFISTVSHELRTPLTAIRSLSEILRDYPDTHPQEQQDFLNIMINEIHRLSRLINQVLDFQKIESGIIHWQIEPVDLIQIIKDAVDGTRRLVADQQMHMTLDLPGSVPAISGDRDKLIQAMINLISNAVKFCETQKGRIHITLTWERHQLRVSVRDNGIGLRDEDQEAVFEQFRQITQPNGRGRPKGSGLGLAITKRIIDYHQGKIWAEGKPGKGACFTFVLPALPVIEKLQTG
ncbi:MAG: histidine kinase [Desulfatitalea sp.]|nr:sensor histidine kinase [Desulfatitalea sp.]NNJ98835.1 histidine kinase [Desulfatitalea sp.]